MLTAGLRLVATVGSMDNAACSVPIFGERGGGGLGAVTMNPVACTGPAPSLLVLPRTAVDPPGGLFGSDALRISWVKFCGWFAITLHCLELCEFW